MRAFSRPARPIWSMAFKTLVFVLGVLGQYFGLRRNGFHVARQLVYYTNISNILITLLSGGLAFALCRHHRAGTQARFARWVGVLRFALAAGILLTFTVFSLLLTPMLNRSYLLSADNLLVHNAVPLLAALDYMLFDEGLEDGQPRIGWAYALPAAYFVLTLVLMQSGVRYAGGASAPYYFLNVRTLGWFGVKRGQLGVLWWVVILCLLHWVLARLLQGLRSMVKKHGER